MAQLFDLDKRLSEQAVRLLPQQVALVAVFVAASAKDLGPWWLVIPSVCFLALSFCVSAAAVSRVLGRPAWTAADAAEVVSRSAQMMAQKALSLRYGAWILLLAAVAVACRSLDAVL